MIGTYKPRSKGGHSGIRQHSSKAGGKDNRSLWVLQPDGYQAAARVPGKQKALQQPKCSWRVFSFPSQEPNYGCKEPLYVHRPSLKTGFREALIGMGRGLCSKHKGRSFPHDSLQPLTGCED